MVVMVPDLVISCSQVSGAGHFVSVFRVVVCGSVEFSFAESLVGEDTVWEQERCH